MIPYMWVLSLCVFSFVFLSHRMSFCRGSITFVNSISFPPHLRDKSPRINLIAEPRINPKYWWEFIGALVKVYNLKAQRTNRSRVIIWAKCRLGCFWKRLRSICSDRWWFSVSSSCNTFFKEPFMSLMSELWPTRVQNLLSAVQSTKFSHKRCNTATSLNIGQHCLLFRNP